MKNGAIEMMTIHIDAVIFSGIYIFMYIYICI